MLRKPLFLLAAFVLAFGLVAAAVPTPAFAATCTSTGTGNWSNSATWDCGTPGPGDTVTVAATHVVTVDTDTAALASLTVAGTVQFDETGTGRTMTVTGNLTVNSGSSFTVSVGGTPTTHTLILGGNLSNSGTFNLSPASATSVIDMTFNKTDGDQSILNGAYRLNKVTLAKGSVSNKVTTARNVDVFGGDNAFTWTAGTWEQTNRLLDFKGGDQSITANGALTISGTGRANFSRALTLSGGSLTVNSTGTSPVLKAGRGDDTFEVGPAAAGGTVTLTAGDVQILGQLVLSSGAATLNGSAVSIDPQGTSNNLGAAKNVFHASADAALTMSGGTVTLVDPNAGSGGGRDLLLVSGAGAKAFTGGTIFLGDGTSSSAGGDGFEIRTGSIPLFNLTVNNQQGGTNRTARLVSDPLLLDGSLTINTGGTLDANGQNISLKGNWTNDGTFTAGTGRVTFNGAAAQTIGGTAITTFNGILFDTGSSVTAPAGDLQVTGNWTNRGAFSANGGAVIFSGTTDQTIGGNQKTVFNNLTVNSGASVVLDVLPDALGTVTNNGTLKQTLNVASQARNFVYIDDGGSPAINKYRGVRIDTTGSAADLGSVTVAVQGNASACTNDAGSPVYAKRCFTITPTSYGAARVRLWVLDSELNGLTGAEIAPYRFAAVAGKTKLDSVAADSSWVRLDNVATGAGSGSYNYTEGDTNALADFQFLAGKETPTAVALREFRSANAGLPAAAALLGLLALAGGLIVARRPRV